MFPGPTDDEWKKKSPEQKNSYKLFMGTIVGILFIMFMVKLISKLF
jgi:hypothetical protein